MMTIQVWVLGLLVSVCGTALFWRAAERERGDYNFGGPLLAVFGCLWFILVWLIVAAFYIGRWAR